MPDANTLQFRIATMSIGGTTKLKILRSGREKELTIRLIAAPEVPLRELSIIGGKNPYAGAEVANLSPALTEELSLDSELTGVIVVRLKRRSPADRIGLEPGDILLRLNGDKISSVSQLKTMLKKNISVWRIEYSRAGQVLKIILRRQ